MDLRFWKHKKIGEVISKQCYNKLPNVTHTYDYEPTYEQPTHKVETDYNDSTSFALTALAAYEVGSMMSDNSNSDFGSSSFDSGSNIDTSSSSDFSGYGGGDFGGGGSSSDW